MSIPKCVRKVLATATALLLWPGAGVAVSGFQTAAPAAGGGARALRQTQTASPAAPKPDPAPPSTPAPAAAQDETIAGQTVKLYYLRPASKLVTVLTAIAAQEGSELSGLVITTATDNEIILYGPKEKRDRARRVIATLDLPRPGVEMEMWGVQISSRKPEKMAEVMPKVRGAINRTQQAVRETYSQLERITRQNFRAVGPDEGFRSVLEDELFYRSSLSNSNRPLSLTDILMRMVAAQKPGEVTADIANQLDGWLAASQFRDYAESVTKKGRRPFERFFTARGLRLENGKWADRDGLVEIGAAQGRVALLEFGLQYGRLIHDPRNFSPYALHQAADTLNTRLQAAIDALNLDTQELFVEPTLDEIRRIVGGFKDVEYAQAGKTSVAGLSGTTTEVKSYSVSAFDVTPPLTLTELFSKAQAVSTAAGPFAKETKEPGAQATDVLVGNMPLAQVIGLIGALGEERAVWRELKAGISLNITPNVLRNMNSAELQIVLETGDPQAGTRENNVRPLSRVSQHDVKTSVYVNALDFFDLSAFASQSTLSGGRGYVPIIGPIWRGIFSDVPVFGNLFSWQKGPQNVYHESLVLTTSFISPTAMGVAVLYPTELTDQQTGERINYDEAVFAKQWQAVRSYVDPR